MFEKKNSTISNSNTYNSLKDSPDFQSQVFNFIRIMVTVSHLTSGQVGKRWQLEEWQTFLTNLYQLVVGKIILKNVTVFIQKIL